MNKETIEAICQGDEQAFSDVYNSYCNKVYSVAFWVLKNEFDAEDIMQEVFIKLPGKLHALNNIEGFESWLFRMTKNAAIDYQRKYKPIVFSEIDAKYEEDDFSFVDTLESDNRDFQPEASIDYSETKRIIREIINNLPPEQKECVFLRFSEGMPLTAISNRIGVPLPTVKSRLKYGKQKIEEAIKEYEKKGTKLYGVSGVVLIPFLYWLLSNGQKTSQNIARKAASLSNIGFNQNTVNMGTPNDTSEEKSCSGNKMPDDSLQLANPVSSSTMSKATAGASVAKRAGKHVFLKALAGVLSAAAVSLGTIAIVNPELLSNIFAVSTPEKTVEAYANSINEHDMDAFLECCEPGFEDIVEEAEDTPWFFCFFGYGNVMSVLTDIGNAKCTVKILSCETEGDTATVKAQFSFKIFGDKKEEYEELRLKKYDGKWLITAESLGY